MGVFYLQVNDEIWEMDSTSSVSQNIKGTLSSSRVEDGQVSSDNYVTDPITVTFSGVISDIKALTNNNRAFNQQVSRRSTNDYLQTLKRVYKSKQPIGVSFSAENDFLDNCFFTSLNITQDQRHGVLYNDGTFKGSYRLNFTLQQVRLARRAEDVSAPSQAISDDIAAKSERDASVTDPCSQFTGAARELCEANLDLAVNQAGAY